MMDAMSAGSHLCKHCVSTLLQIHFVNFVAKTTNGVQLLFQVKVTFVRLKFPVCATTQLLGSVLEFWDTLQSTMPMLGEYNMYVYMTYIASKHSRRKIFQEIIYIICMISLHVQVYPLRLILWLCNFLRHVVAGLANVHHSVLPCFISSYKSACEVSDTFEKNSLQNGSCFHMYWTY